MGLQIGFDLFKKEINQENKEIKLIPVNFYDGYLGLGDTWICGRCTVTKAWDYGFKLSLSNEKEADLDEIPTFDKELDGWISPKNDYDYQYKLRYIPFEEYKNAIMKVVQKVYDDHSKYIQELSKIIKNINDKIKHYEDLQLKCTEDNKFAFDKWQEKIDELEEENQRNYSIMFDDDPEDEDYDYNHAKAVEKLIKNMENYQKEGYVVIPFYSF